MTSPEQPVQTQRRGVLCWLGLVPRESKNDTFEDVGEGPAC